MNNKPLKFTLIGITATSAAATTTTLGLHIWAPQVVEITLEIPFVLGGATFVGLLLLGTTFMVDGNQTVHQVQTRPSIEQVTTSTITTSVTTIETIKETKARYRVRYPNSTEPKVIGCMNRIYFTQGREDIAVQDFLASQDWNEVKEGEPGHRDLDIINIDILMLGRRSGDTWSHPDSQSLHFYLREETSTSPDLYTMTDSEFIFNERTTNTEASPFYAVTDGQLQRFTVQLQAKKQILAEKWADTSVSSAMVPASNTEVALPFPQPKLFYRLKVPDVMDQGCGLGNIVIIPENERQALGIPVGRRISMRELLALRGWQEAGSEQTATVTINLFQRRSSGRGGLANEFGANNLAGENKINIVIKERNVFNHAVARLYSIDSEPADIPPFLSMDSIFAYEAEGPTSIGVEEKSRALTPIDDNLSRMLAFMDGIERRQNAAKMVSSTIVSTPNTSSTISTTNTTTSTHITVTLSALDTLGATTTNIGQNKGQ